MHIDRFVMFFKILVTNEILGRRQSMTQNSEYLNKYVGYKRLQNGTFYYSTVVSELMSLFVGDKGPVYHNLARKQPIKRGI